MNNYTVTVYIEISIMISGITPTKLFWIKQGLIYKNLGQVHKYKMGLVQTIYCYSHTQLFRNTYNLH